MGIWQGQGQRVNARLGACRRKGRLRGLGSSLRRQASRPTAQRRGFQPLASQMALVFFPFSGYNGKVILLSVAYHFLICDMIT